MFLNVLGNRILLILVFCLPLFSSADALVVTRAMTASTIAQVYIEKDQIRTELEIGWADVAGFKNLLPSGIYEKLGFEPTPVEERFKRFLAEDLAYSADGNVIPGIIPSIEIRKRVVRDDITGEPVTQADEAEDVLFVEIIHPLESLPQTFSLKPPQNHSGAPVATVGFMVYHQGLPVNDFRYLSREELLMLDWEDPWYSQFENRNLWRQYNEAINVFLYVEPYETRIEVVVRPKDIQEWMDLGIQRLETIPVEKQREVIEKIATFLPINMQLEIDGVIVQPQFDRANFLKRTLRNSTVIDPSEDLDVVSATLGVIYTVPTETLPQSASLTWNLFSPKQQNVRAASTDEAGPLPYFLRPDDNVLIWKNFLTNPTVPGRVPIGPSYFQRKTIPLVPVMALILAVPVSIILYRKKGRNAVVAVLVFIAAGGLVGNIVLPNLQVQITKSYFLADEGKHDLTGKLLRNVYASFDFNGESAIYDALDQSLSGDLLNRVYLETMKSLELKSQGGARVKVKELTLNEASYEEEDTAFYATCTWDVRGAVGHWGHVHERINSYTADLKIEPVDGEWKISQLDILEEQRVK